MTSHEIEVTGRNGKAGSIWVFFREEDQDPLVYPVSIAPIFAVTANSVLTTMRRAKMILEATTKDEQVSLMCKGLIKSLHGRTKPGLMRLELAIGLFKHYGCTVLYDGLKEEIAHAKKEGLLEEKTQSEDTPSGLTQAMDEVVISSQRQALHENCLGDEARAELDAMKRFCVTPHHLERLRRGPLREKSWKHYRSAIMRFYGFLANTHPRTALKLSLFSRMDFVREYMTHLQESAKARPVKAGKARNGIHAVKVFLDAGIKALQYIFRAQGPGYTNIESYRVLLDLAAEMQRDINQDVGNKTKANIANWVDYEILIEAYVNFRAKAYKKLGDNPKMAKKSASLIKEVVALGLSLLVCPGRSADSYELCLDEPTAMATVDGFGDEMGRWIAKDAKIPGAYRVHLARHKNSSKAFNGKIEKDLPADFSFWIDLYLTKARPYLIGGNKCPFFFFQDRTSTGYDHNTYYSYLSIRFSKLCGKKIGPTLIRKIVITHFEELGPSPQDRESRAFAMGHKEVTAKQIYASCVPSSKTALAGRLLHDTVASVQSNKRKTSEAPLEAESQGDSNDKGDEDADTTSSDDDLPLAARRDGATNRRRTVSELLALIGDPIGRATILPAEKDREPLLGVIVAVSDEGATVEFTDGEVYEIEKRYALKHASMEYPRVKVVHGRVVKKASPCTMEAVPNMHIGSNADVDMIDDMMIISY